MTDKRATPKMIAAAWQAWHSRHGGKLGPGPAFVEAINAALEMQMSETKIPTMSFRWFIDYDGEKILQQLFRTSTGDVWERVPEVEYNEHD